MAWYDEVHAVKKYRLGTEKRAVDGRRFIYLQGVASCAVGSAVIYDEDFVTILTDSDAAASCNGPVAIAMAVVDATTEWGWFGIWGEFTVKAADPVADNTAAYITGTAGVLDDAPGSASLGRVQGATFRSVNNSVAGTATIQVQYPYAGPDLSA